MLRRLWLIFAQTATIAVAMLFVVATFRPDWLPRRGMSDWMPVVTQQVMSGGSTAQGGMPGSFAAAVAKAIPAVVSINTS